eukprot:5455742-Amphidinium_carterae.1
MHCCQSLVARRRHLVCNSWIRLCQGFGCHSLGEQSVALQAAIDSRHSSRGCPEKRTDVAVLMPDGTRLALDMAVTRSVWQ